MSRHRAVRITDLPDSGTSWRFDGFEHGAGVSLFFNRQPPGAGPRLHTHPYPETFVVEDGLARFTVDGETVEATGRTVVVVPAETPHKFVNAGTSPLRMISIHASERMQTEWLE